MIDTHTLPLVNNRKPQAFIVDHKTYWYRCSTAEEAYFLAAFLNAPCVDNAIKKYQTRGQRGERDIHRRPFEVCAIPLFDPNSPDHQELATLSREVHILVAGLDASMKVVGKRRQVRQAAGMFINRIDAIAEQILKSPYQG